MLSAVLSALALTALFASPVEANAGISTFQQVRQSKGILAISPFTSKNSPGLAFTGCDDDYGCELWFYDFVNEPVLVADIDPGAFHSSPTEFKLNGTNMLYFAATTSATGQELYRWDGSEGISNVSVSLIYDLNIGPQSSYPSKLCMLNGLLYFSAFLGPTVGTELAVYDPNVMDPLPPVSMVQDINRGSASSFPTSLIAYNGKLFFQADGGATGVELWVYDPNTMVASMVTDLMPGRASSYPTWFTPFNNKLYFQAIGPNVGGELYSYDASRGVGNEVMLVADIAPGNKSLFATPGVNEPAPSYPAELTAWGNSLLFFYAQSEVNGSELYVMRANEAVSFVTDLNPGVDGSDPSSLVIFGGGLYYAAYTPTWGKELWFVNLTTGAPGPYSPTASGIPLPILAADINNGSSSSGPNYLTVANQNKYLYFSAFNQTYRNGMWQANDASWAGTALPTSTPTPTPTGTGTPNATMSPNVTATPSSDPTITPNSTVSISLSITPSLSYTPTAPETPSHTRTMSESLSNSETASETRTPSETRTGTRTPSISFSQTSTVSVSFSKTPTRSPTMAPSISASPTASASVPARPSFTASPTVLSGVGIGANAANAAGESGPAVDTYALTVGLSVTFSVVGALICAYGFYWCYWKPKLAAEDAAERAELRREDEEARRHGRRRHDEDDDDDDDDSPAFSKGKRAGGNGVRPSRPGGPNRGGRPMNKALDDDDEYGGYDERELGPDHLAALEDGGPAVVGMAGGRRGAGPKPSMRQQFPATGSMHSGIDSYRSTSARQLIGAARTASRSGRLLSSSRDMLAPAVSPDRLGSMATTIPGRSAGGNGGSMIINPVMGAGGVNAIITPGGRRITAVPRPPGVGGSSARPQSAVISRGGVGAGGSLASPMGPSPQVRASQFDAYRAKPTNHVSPTRPKGLDV
jgi:ELWxxDGT repeat protein